VSANKRKALGRGLAALIPQAGVGASVAGSVGGADNGREGKAGSSAMPQTAAREGLALLPIEAVKPSRVQPRKVFNEARLNELAESIRTQGIIEPLVVRHRENGGYDIIAGERRWRAAQKAGLREVPVLIKDVVETRAFEMALVENLQREDLNPIEESEGYQRLISEFGYTQEMLASRVGKDRSTVANALRLLRLPESVRALVVNEKLSMGHARALLGLESLPAMEQLARQATARGLSVRAVEALVRKARDQSPAGPGKPTKKKPSAAARDLGERLQRALGTRVSVVEASPTTGRLEIHYHSLDELDRLLEQLLPQ